MISEWKKGYEEGFAAGWKSAKEELSAMNNNPYYVFPQTMNDQPYNISTSVDLGTVVLKEEKPSKPDLKVIHNLTDHTRIV